MSIASISSGSPAWFQRSIDAVAAASAVQRHGEAANEAPGDEPPLHRHPLVAAMMAALQGLLPSGTNPVLPSATPAADAAAAAAEPALASTVASAPPATGTSAQAGTASASTTPEIAASVGLKQAASAFAHELFLALKGTGSNGDGRAQGHGGGEHRHHGDDSLAGGAYGDLAQRLETLAQKLTGQAPAATSATPAAVAAVPSGDSAAPTAAPTAATRAATAVAPEPPASASVTNSGTDLSITIHIRLGNGDATTPAAGQAPGAPLLNAFNGLLAALDPTGASSATSSQSLSQSSAPTATAKLAAFLHQMAQALAPSASATGLPGTGGLLNVRA